jgi:hypothetical protein
MNWGDIIGLVFILAALIGIIWTMFGTRAPSPDTPPISRLGALLCGLLAAAALGSSVQSAAPGWPSGLASGTGVGILFAFATLLPANWKSVAIDGLALVFGVTGVVVTVSIYFQPLLSCTPADVGQRAFGFLAIAVALVVGGAFAWTKGIFRLSKLGPTLLAVFGALEIVEFLSSPLGVSLVVLGIAGWLVALVAALALGFAASIWPNLVIGLGAAMVAIGSVIGTVSGSATNLCLPGSDVSGLAPLIGFAGLYFAVLAVVTFARARSAKKSEVSSTE